MTRAIKGEGGGKRAATGSWKGYTPKNQATGVRCYPVTLEKELAMAVADRGGGDVCVEGVARGSEKGNESPRLRGIEVCHWTKLSANVSGLSRAPSDQPSKGPERRRGAAAMVEVGEKGKRSAPDVARKEYNTAKRPSYGFHYPAGLLEQLATAVSKRQRQETRLEGVGRFRNEGTREGKEPAVAAVEEGVIASIEALKPGDLRQLFLGNLRKVECGGAFEVASDVGKARIFSCSSQGEGKREGGWGSSRVEEEGTLLNDGAFGKVYIESYPVLPGEYTIKSPKKVIVIFKWEQLCCTWFLLLRLKEVGLMLLIVLYKCVKG